MEGHLTDPYEQNTQQSPTLGRRTTWQAAHSWKKAQASVGIRSTDEHPHLGHVRVDSSIGMFEVVVRGMGATYSPHASTRYVLDE